jgi:hypothetical protein
MNGLTCMIMGSGQVSLLSGRIRRYRVGLGLTGRIRLRHAVRAREQLGRARAGRQSGPSRIQPNKLGKIVNPFSFSNLFYKFQTNLNSIQIQISTTLICKIKYKNISPHKEKYATVRMQQIIIYLNI